LFCKTEEGSSTFSIMIMNCSVNFDNDKLLVPSTSSGEPYNHHPKVSVFINIEKSVRSQHEIKLKCYLYVIFGNM
jgi:hypothetical protein